MRTPAAHDPQSKKAQYIVSGPHPKLPPATREAQPYLPSSPIRSQTLTACPNFKLSLYSSRNVSSHSPWLSASAPFPTFGVTITTLVGLFVLPAAPNSARLGT